MTFKELIRKNQWAEVKPQILNMYPDQTEAIQNYEYLFYKFQLMQETDSDLTIFLTKNRKEDTEEFFVEVTGKFETLSDTGNSEIHYTIMEFTPWNVWLGSKIDPDTLTEFPESHIIAHFMWEMTFFGWDEGEIETQLEGMAKTLKSMIEDDKKSAEES